MTTYSAYYFNEFRASLPKSLPAVTRASYDNHVRSFFEFAGDSIALADVTGEFVAKFTEWLTTAKRYSVLTAENRASFIRRVLRRAIPTPRPPRKRKRRRVKAADTRATRIERAPAGTIEQFFRDEFAPNVLSDSAAKTKRQYATAVNKFAEFTGGYSQIANLDRGQIEAFREWAIEKCGNNVTPGKYAAHLKRILVTYRPALPQPNVSTRKIIDSEAPEGSVRWFYESRYATEHEGCEKHRVMVRAKLRAFSRHLGREPMLADLNAVTLNAYLGVLLAGRMSAWTVQNYKATFRALWQAAYDWELLEKPPGRLMKITRPPMMPDAWKPDEYQRLLDACDGEWFKRLRGGTVPLGKFLRAAVMLNYDTALRFGDLLKTEWSQLNQDGTLPVAMGKTAFAVVCQVSPETIMALRAIRRRDDPRLLPWPIKDVRRLWRDYRKLRQAAGLSAGSRSAFQKLRRTSATYVERDTPGAASQHLGHRSPRLAQQHYIDRSIAHTPRLPPRIGAAADTAAT